MQQQPLEILSYEWGWSNIRSDVFQLLAWGYQNAREEIRERHLEEDITGLIRRGIREKLDEELPLRFSFYSPHNEDPVDDCGVCGKERPRIDILIECSGCPPRKRYRFEAKRCGKGTHPISWYVDGVSAYVTRRYAKDAPEAGLIGLVQTHSGTYWQGELAVKLEDDPKLSSVHPLEPAALTPDIVDTSLSVHRRDDGSEITLFHAFLDCTP